MRPSSLLTAAKSFILGMVLLIASSPAAAFAQDECVRGATQVCNNNNGCSGGTQRCMFNTHTFETYWSACSGSGTAACNVCGRTGTASCTNGVPVRSTCTAKTSEQCNNCDDDLNGYLDEAAGVQKSNSMTTCTTNWATSDTSNDVDSFFRMHCGGKPVGGVGTQNTCPCFDVYDSSAPANEAGGTGANCLATNLGVAGGVRTPLSTNTDACRAGQDCRVRVAAAPDGTKGFRFATYDGDQYQNKSGERNELVFTREGGADFTKYGQGDNRYYAWKTFFDTLAPVHGDSSEWIHTFLQFHEDGNCGGEAQPITMGVYRNASNQPEFRLYASSTYGGTPTLLWTGPVVQTQRWYRFILHVKWDADAECNNANMPPEYTNPDKGWACYWPAPNGGAIELWMDGALQNTWKRKTLMTWPGTRACEADIDDNVPTSGAMPVYLKTGLYRNAAIGANEVIFHSGFKAAETCAACLWPEGCPRNSQP